METVSVNFRQTYATCSCSTFEDSDYERVIYDLPAGQLMSAILQIALDAYYGRAHLEKKLKGS